MGFGCCTWPGCWQSSAPCCLPATCLAPPASTVCWRCHSLKMQHVRPFPVGGVFHSMLAFSSQLFAFLKESKVLCPKSGGCPGLSNCKYKSTSYNFKAIWEGAYWVLSLAWIACDSEEDANMYDQKQPKPALSGRARKGVETPGGGAVPALLCPLLCGQSRGSKEGSQANSTHLIWSFCSLKI